jgi:hypothetical protein
MIPEPQFKDAMLGQILRAPRIKSPLVRETVLSAIQLDREFGGGTKEIEGVGTNLVLAAELEAGQLAIVKLAPQNALLVGGSFSQGARRLDMPNPLTLILSPIGWGRGNRSARWVHGRVIGRFGATFHGEKSGRMRFGS